MISDADGYFVSTETLARLGDGDVTAGRRVLRTIIDIEATHPPIVGPTEKPPNVRAAVPGDEAAIMDLVRLDLAENARKVAPASEAKIMEIVTSATRDLHATIGVIDGPDGLVGMICLVPYAWWWSEAWFVTEFWNYVHPAHRASRHAADLIKFSRWVADDMTARLGYRVFLISGVMATRDARGKTALYRRLLNWCGGTFVYPQP